MICDCLRIFEERLEENLADPVANALDVILTRCPEYRS
jgi:hypothetical protein